jgi:toxin ParE1/3/4
MGLKILWTDFALAQLEGIYDYYKHNATTQVAKKLVKFIVKESLILAKKHLLGQKEPLLSHKVYEYRYLVLNNYKIIYRFTENLITIVSVFDCRQNPQKIEGLSEQV